MLIRNRCYCSFLGALLLASNAAIAAEDGEIPAGPLRRGKFGRGVKSSIYAAREHGFEEKTIHLMDLGQPATKHDETVRVMIACREVEDKWSCKKRIGDAVRQNAVVRLGNAAGSAPAQQTIGVVRFTHYLDLCHAYSVEVHSVSDLNGVEGVQDDKPRETLHIRDSIKVHRRLQYSSQATPYGIAMVKALEAREKYQTSGENVRVCVMDTGVNRDHPDLDQLFGYDGNELVSPWWRDVDGHGTHVTGTIAATDNDRGVVGVAPGAEIFTARVFSTNGQFFSSNIITALQVCKDGGAQVISMSLGGPDLVSYEKQAYEDLYEKFGIVTVAASGNSGSYTNIYPAAYDNVISVASVNWNRERSSFSTANSNVNVAAPGESIVSTWENGNYASVSGTSMACPHVSGVVALMLSKNPTATPAQIFNALYSTAENPNTSGKDSLLGYGVVNALAAVEAISNVDGNAGNDSSGGSDGGSGTDSGTSTGTDTGTGNNNSGCVELVITLQTDKHPEDTSHLLVTGSESVFYDNDFDSYDTYQETACIDPARCTKYYIRDSFGDGLSGEGVEIKYGGQVVYSGGDFAYGGIKELGTC